MKMLHLVTVLFTLFGVVSSEWGVKVPARICAVKGSTVSIPCYYYYPPGIQVTRKIWCTTNTNQHYCVNPPYVYDSSVNATSNFVYIGDNTSNCTTLIHNVDFSYSGEYRFRFITTELDGRYTGIPGVMIQVGDLTVSLIRLSGNGTIKPGDSLNLTCELNCTQNSSQFIWSKNNKILPQSGPNLYFPAVTAKDSGNYTCTWETSETSGSKMISIYIEESEKSDQAVWIAAVLTAVVIFIVLVILAFIIYKRMKDSALEDNSGKAGEQSQEKQLPQPNEEVSKQDEVTYATVIVKDNGPVHADLSKTDDFVIYSTVKVQ